MSRPAAEVATANKCRARLRRGSPTTAQMRTKRSAPIFLPRACVDSPAARTTISASNQKRHMMRDDYFDDIPVHPSATHL